MTTQYGMLNTSFFSAWVAAWPSDAGDAPTTEALAIALAMPSVERSGQPGTRASLKAPGLGSYYLATAFRWATGDVSQGCIDAVYTASTGSPSNKQNNMTGLVAGGFIQRYRVGSCYQVALTDAGLAQVKLVSPELAKVAKGFTVSARDKALKAFTKASQPVKAKAKRKAKPVETEVITEQQVEVSYDYPNTEQPSPVEHQQAE